MSRIPAVAPATAPANVKASLKGLESALRMTPNMFRVIANSGAALRGMIQLNAALGGGSLDRATREAIAIAAAQENGCDYCLSAHTAFGRQAGLDDIGLALARAGKATDPKRHSVLQLTEAILKKRGHISAEEFADAKRAGISDAEVVQIVAEVALNVYTNYLNVLADTEIDFPVVRTTEPSPQ